MFNFLFFTTFWLFILKTTSAVDCFKCISMNGDYTPCEDPFHHNFTLDIYKSPCMGGRKGRDGLYPATSCVKLNGIFEDNKETLVIRSCALDSGTLTTDTELVRMSHCGAFVYQNRYVRGCVQTCNDQDGCNTAGKKNIANIYNHLGLIVSLNLFYKLLFLLQV